MYTTMGLEARYQRPLMKCFRDLSAFGGGDVEVLGCLVVPRMVWCLSWALRGEVYRLFGSHESWLDNVSDVAGSNQGSPGLAGFRWHNVGVGLPFAAFAPDGSSLGSLGLGDREPPVGRPQP